MIKTTIVGFGDSLTFGYGVDVNVCYIDRLEKYMPLYYPSISWNIINAGIKGDTATQGFLRLKRDVLIHNPNIVIILFGTNEACCSGETKTIVDEYEKTLCTIVQDIRAHNNRTGLNGCIPIPVLVTLPPVIEQDGLEATNKIVSLLADACRKTAAQQNCLLVDFHTYLLEESGEILAPYFQQDGVHLSTKGYDCLYDCIFSGVTKLINYEGILKELDCIEEQEAL